MTCQEVSVRLLLQKSTNDDTRHLCPLDHLAEANSWLPCIGSWQQTQRNLPLLIVVMNLQDCIVNVQTGWDDEDDVLIPAVARGNRVGERLLRMDGLQALRSDLEHRGLKRGNEIGDRAADDADS
jgi:hypothetical protein